jgi:PhzF family phenazine biosynthesis protein
MSEHADLYVVDAFADGLFSGNPAAVCPLRSPAPDTAMQALAGEMNLSETAFTWPEQDGWHLRWFTPNTEVRLCGHATLATAHVLWQSGIVDHESEINFDTLSGRLQARQIETGIEMDFPSEPASVVDDDEVLASIARALRTTEAPVAVGRNRMDLLVELLDEAAVRALGPDFSALMDLDARGVMVTSRAGAATAETLGVDFVSRFFAPAVGVPEDPVTGSAHCALGPWWADRLGRNRLKGVQVSQRGGIVGIVCNGDRVGLSGSATTVLTATLAEGIRTMLEGEAT